MVQARGGPGPRLGIDAKSLPAFSSTMKCQDTYFPFVRQQEIFRFATPVHQALNT
jgi:hypothetical protein